MKPILFNTEMVRAILNGRKTVTRRVVKEPWYIEDEEVSRVSGLAMHRGTDSTHMMPYDGQLYFPGDILYVRETWCLNNFGYHYRADDNDQWISCDDVWRPSIHMPKEAARLFLRVKDVRVERLQDIDEIQADEEGAEGTPCDCDGSEAFCSRCCNTGWLTSPRSEFAGVWNRTIKSADRATYGWEANPWVWVIEFEQITKEEAERGTAQV